MKKISYLFLLIPICISAQIINFPDANFKTKLLSSTATNNVAKNAAGASIKIDAKNNGEIEQSEALQVYRLFEVAVNLSGNIPFKMANTASASPISDLTGIAFFTNLRHLNVSYNQLTNLNLSSNTQLQELYCVSNQLISINLSNNLALKTLSVSSNQLTTLNLSNNSLLEGLNCDNNSLSNLNLSNLTALKYVYANGNNLSALVTSANNQLRNLS